MKDQDETSTKYFPLMQLQVKIPQNSTNNLFRRKQAKYLVVRKFFCFFFNFFYSFFFYHNKIHPATNYNAIKNKINKTR